MNNYEKKGVFMSKVSRRIRRKHLPKKVRCHKCGGQSMVYKQGYGVWECPCCGQLRWGREEE